MMKMLATLLFCLVATGVAQDEEICTPCGCFNNEPPFDEFYPLPQEPGDGIGKQGINWRLYNKDIGGGNDYIEISYEDEALPEEFNPQARTVFLVHGWNASPMVSTKDAYLNGHVGEDYNLVLLDWAGGRMVRYWQCAANARVAGACSALLAKNMVDLTGASWDDMQCVGHSLGAQFCGFMGKESNGTMGRVTGLDPAGPWFNKDDPAGRIDIDDADFVDVIHTSAGNISLGLGHMQVGDVDIFPNKGYNQPPCFPIGSCDHNIVGSYWRSSLTEEDCTFTAYPCEDEDDVDEGLCETCEQGVDCQRMGHFSEEMPGRGNFYLRTTADAPYCED